MGAEEDALLRLREGLGFDEVRASVASSAPACRKFFFFPHGAAVSLRRSALRWQQVLSLLRQDQRPVDEVDVASRTA